MNRGVEKVCNAFARGIKQVEADLCRNQAQDADPRLVRRRQAEESEEYVGRECQSNSVAEQVDAVDGEAQRRSVQRVCSPGLFRYTASRVGNTPNTPCRSAASRMLLRAGPDG